MTLTAAKIIELYTALRFNKAISLDASLTGSSAAAATTGAVSVPMTSSVVTVTPTGNITFNAAITGKPTQQVTFIVTTSGVVIFVLSWATNFRSSGPLNTGVTSGKVYTISFQSDGTKWNETGRTGPL